MMRWMIWMEVQVMEAEEMGVTRAYNDALMQTFYVFTALASLSIFGALWTEWKSVKGKKIEMVPA